MRHTSKKMSPFTPPLLRTTSYKRRLDNFVKNCTIAFDISGLVFFSRTLREIAISIIPGTENLKKSTVFSIHSNSYYQAFIFRTKTHQRVLRCE